MEKLSKLTNNIIKFVIIIEDIDEKGDDDDAMKEHDAKIIGNFLEKYCNATCKYYLAGKTKRRK